MEINWNKKNEAELAAEAFGRGDFQALRAIIENRWKELAKTTSPADMIRLSLYKAKSPKDVSIVCAIVALAGLELTIRSMEEKHNQNTIISN